MTARHKAFIAILLGAIVGGAVSPATKIGLREIPPLSFAFIRFFIASLMVLPFYLRPGRNVKKDILTLTPVSLLASLNICLFVLGLRTTTATISQLLYAGVPLLTGLIIYLLWKDRLTLRQVIGIAIGFAGVSSVVLLPVLEQGKPFSGDLFGNFLITIGVISYSFYMVLSKRVQEHSSPFGMTSLFIFTTTFVLAPFFLIEVFSGNTDWVSISQTGWTAVAYVAFLGTIVTYLLNQHAIKYGGSLVASTLLYLAPIVTFLMSFVLLGEQLTPGLVIGGTLALIGIFLVTHK